MTNFTNMIFWYWLYNQLFFLIGALGFLLVLFVVGLLGLGGMDTAVSFVLDVLLLSLLYKWFGRFYWRGRLAQYAQAGKTLATAAVLPVIAGSVVLTVCFALAGGNHKETMIGMPFLAVVNLSFAYLPLANSVWTMLVLAVGFNLLSLGCFVRYCRQYAALTLPWRTLVKYLAYCFAICTGVIYYFTLVAAGALK